MMETIFIDMLKWLKYLIIFIVSLIIFGWLAFMIFGNPDIPVDEIKEKYGLPQSKYISIEDIEVHYSIEGSGKDTLVLIHGTGSSLHTWQGWVDQLKDSLVLVRMDLPAFGITGPFANRDYSTEHYVTFLNQFFNELELGDFLMAGNSFGGYLTWNYALTFPERVKKIILLDASGYPSNHSIGVFKLAKNPITASILKRLTPRRFIRKNLEEVYVRDSLISEKLVDRYWHMARRKGNRQAFIDRVNMVTQDRSHLINGITQPTLILWGDGDTWTDVDHAYLFHKDIRKSRLIIYPEIGHTVMEEDPETSARDALRFIQE